jgi:hypothetical protein
MRPLYSWGWVVVGVAGSNLTLNAADPVAAPLSPYFAQGTTLASAESPTATVPPDTGAVEPVASFNLAGLNRLERGLEPQASTMGYSFGESFGAAGWGATDDERRGYFLVKAGPLWFARDDLNDLNPSLYAELTFGWRLVSILYFELAPGGFGGLDESGSVDIRAWGSPFFANLRLGIPITIVEISGGAGIGGVYIHSEAEAGSSTQKDDDIVIALDAFAGVYIHLGPVIVGAEAKYFYSDVAELAGGASERFEALAVMASVGVSF